MDGAARTPGSISPEWPRAPPAPLSVRSADRRAPPGPEAAAGKTARSHRLPEHQALSPQWPAPTRPPLPSWGRRDRHRPTEAARRRPAGSAGSGSRGRRRAGPPVHRSGLRHVLAMLWSSTSNHRDPEQRSAWSSRCQCAPGRSRRCGRGAWPGSGGWSLTGQVRFVLATGRVDFRRHNGIRTAAASWAAMQLARADRPHLGEAGCPPGRGPAAVTGRGTRRPRNGPRTGRERDVIEADLVRRLATPVLRTYRATGARTRA